MNLPPVWETTTLWRGSKNARGTVATMPVAESPCELTRLLRIARVPLVRNANAEVDHGITYEVSNRDYCLEASLANF